MQRRRECLVVEEPMGDYEVVRLNIPGEVERLMEERGIRREDLQKVVHHAESSGEKFHQPFDRPNPGILEAWKGHLLGRV